MISPAPLPDRRDSRTLQRPERREFPSFWRPGAPSSPILNRGSAAASGAHARSHPRRPDRQPIDPYLWCAVALNWAPCRCPYWRDRYARCVDRLRLQTHCVSQTQTPRERVSPRRGSIAETIARSLRLPIRKGTCRLRKADDIDITPAPGSREAVAMISDAIPSPAVGFFAGAGSAGRFRSAPDWMNQFGTSIDRLL